MIIWPSEDATAELSADFDVILDWSSFSGPAMTPGTDGWESLFPRLDGSETQGGATPSRVAGTIVVDGSAELVLTSFAGSDHVVIEVPGTPASGETWLYTGTEVWVTSYLQTITAVVSGTRLVDRLSGTSGNDEASGKGGADRIEGRAGDDWLRGGDGDDRILGGEGGDRLYGERGDDRLIGGVGNDAISGGAGNDTLDGGAGDDVIVGGRGFDRMFGGTGADRFVFQAVTDSRITGAGPDFVVDFNREEGDRIDLSALVSGTVSFIGTDRFSGTGPEIGYSVSRHEAVLTGDLDGDGRADFALRVHGVETLYASDLVLA